MLVHEKYQTPTSILKIIYSNFSAPQKRKFKYGRKFWSRKKKFQTFFSCKWRRVLSTSSDAHGDDGKIIRTVTYRRENNIWYSWQTVVSHMCPVKVKNGRAVLPWRTSCSPANLQRSKGKDTVGRRRRGRVQKYEKEGIEILINQ